MVGCHNSEFEEGDEENCGGIDGSRGGPVPGVEASGSGTGGRDRCVVALVNFDAVGVNRSSLFCSQIGNHKHIFYISGFWLFLLVV